MLTPIILTSWPYCILSAFLSVFMMAEAPVSSGSTGSTGSTVVEVPIMAHSKH